MLNLHKYQAVSGHVVLGTGDSTKTIIAAPGAQSVFNAIVPPGIPDYALIINRVTAEILTAAAQLITIKGSVSGIVVCEIAASATGLHSWNNEKGIRLAAGDALVAVPAAAGPSVDFNAEGYVN